MLNLMFFACLCVLTLNQWLMWRSLHKTDIAIAKTINTMADQLINLSRQLPDRGLGSK